MAATAMGPSRFAARAATLAPPRPGAAPIGLPSLRVGVGIYSDYACGTALSVQRSSLPNVSTIRHAGYRQRSPPRRGPRRRWPAIRRPGRSRSPGANAHDQLPIAPADADRRADRPEPLRSGLLDGRGRLEARDVGPRRATSSRPRASGDDRRSRAEAARTNRTFVDQFQALRCHHQGQCHQRLRISSTRPTSRSSSAACAGA